MKTGKIFHRFIFILSIMVIICLTFIPATPSLALTGTISISPSSGPVDDNDSFSAMFKAPASEGGGHNISANDGTSIATALFSMDSTPPTAPIPLMPLNGTEEDIQTSFVWSPVTDPSGVTYNLEVATDSAFQNIVLEKSDLKDVEYTLTPSEALQPVSQQNPYYWRVRAVDGAGNESPWSEPQSFSVGFVLPQWSLYTILGAGAIILALFTFWLGRKTKETKS